jgi:hypothetical protein
MSSSRDLYPDINGNVFWFYLADVIVGLESFIIFFMKIIGNNKWRTHALTLKECIVNFCHYIGLETLQTILMKECLVFIMNLLFEVRSIAFKKELKSS